VGIIKKAENLSYSAVTYYYRNGNIYDGQIINGMRHGRGVCFYANGEKYDGYWKENEK